jgi:hypothetical protein
MKRTLSLILLCASALNANQDKLTSTASVIDMETKATLASCTMSWRIKNKHTFIPEDNAQKANSQWDENGRLTGDFEGCQLLLEPQIFDGPKNMVHMQAHAGIIKKTNDGVRCHYRRPNSKWVTVGESSAEDLFEQGHPDGANSPFHTLALVITNVIE